MSTISPVGGMSVRTVKQLFGSAAAPAGADGREATAKKIQELATQKAEATRIGPESSPPGHLRIIFDDGTELLLGPGENPPWVDMEEAKNNSREGMVNFIAAMIYDTVNILAGTLASGDSEIDSQQPIPDEPLPEGALGRAELHLAELREGFENRQFSSFKTFLGEEPPIETMPDGTRRLGEFELFKDVSYGRGKDEHFRISVRWDGENLAMSIIDPKTGEESPFRRSESSLPETFKGMWVNTQA